jgi:hypothetical protein
MTKQLDDKLKSILPEYDRGYLPEIIAQIKQAIADTHYCYHNEQYKGQDVDVMMFGSEWYDRFRKDYFETRDKYEFDMDDVWESAKRAAGLSNE